MKNATKNIENIRKKYDIRNNIRKDTTQKVGQDSKIQENLWSETEGKYTKAHKDNKINKITATKANKNIL